MDKNTLNTLFNCERSSIKDYHCKYCDFTTNASILLQVHLKRFHKKHKSIALISRCTDSYQCKKCSYSSFSLLLLFKHHLTFQHAEPKEPVQDYQYNCVQSGYITLKQSVYAEQNDPLRDHQYCVRFGYQALRESVHAEQKEPVQDSQYNCLQPGYITLTQSVHAEQIDPLQDHQYCRQSSYQTLRESVHTEQKEPVQDNQYNCLQSGYITLKHPVHAVQKDSLQDHQYIYNCVQSGYQTLREPVHAEQKEYVQEYQYNRVQSDYQTLRESVQAEQIEPVQNYQYNYLQSGYITLKQSVHAEQKNPLQDYQYNYNCIQSGYQILRESVHAEQKKSVQDYQNNCVQSGYQTIRESVCAANRSQSGYKTLKQPVLARHVLIKPRDKEIVPKLVNEIIFHCVYCSYTSGLSKLVKKHFILRHREPTNIEKLCVYDCNRCTFVGTSYENLKMHLDICYAYPEKIKWYPCPYCSHKEELRCDLNLHLNTSHVLNYYFSCSVCQYISKFRWFVKKHINSHHMNTVSNNTNEDDSAPKIIQWYQCNECIFASRVKVGLKKHIKKKHTLKNKIQDYQEKITHGSLRKRDLESLPDVRFDIDRHTCPVCRTRYRSKRDLISHIKLKHEKRRKYGAQQQKIKGNPKDIQWHKCAYCTYRYMHQSTMNRHVRLKHKSLSGTTNNQSVSTSRQELKKNIDADSEHSQWFQCDYCPCRVMYKSSLKSHMKSKHIVE